MLQYLEYRANLFTTAR